MVTKGQKMKVKQNSWHFKLAKFAGMYSFSGMKTDFCSYFWSVIFGVGKILLWTLAIFVSCVLFVGSYYELYMWYFHGVKMSEGAITVVILTTSVAGAVLTVFLLMKYLHYRDEHKKEYERKEPGFLLQSYRKFKHKTCIKIEIE